MTTAICGSCYEPIVADRGRWVHTLDWKPQCGLIRDIANAQLGSVYPR